MHRFFVAADHVHDNQIIIDKDQAHHMERVLRLKPGDQVVLFDGTGNEYICRISSLQDGYMQAEIEKRNYDTNEPAVKVILAQGICKGEKMDFVVQKAVEIGVHAIIPFLSERTIVILDEQKAGQKVKRWQSIAREACKQSGRNVIPEIKPITTLAQLLPSLQGQRAIMLYEGEAKEALRNMLLPYKEDLAAQNITILVGPEGGFSPQEAAIAQQNSVALAGLGTRILRTETAGLVAASIILYEGGDLG